MSEMDPCMKFIQDTAVMRLKLKEYYDMLEIKQVRVHPDTLTDIIRSEYIRSYIQFNKPELEIENQLSRIAGFDVRDDLKVPKGEYYYVVKRND